MPQGVRFSTAQKADVPRGTNPFRRAVRPEKRSLRALLLKPFSPVDIAWGISQCVLMFAAFILLITAILFRVLPPLMNVHHDWMGNFSPVASIVLCGAFFFPKKVALWLPLALLAISDLVLNEFAYRMPFFSWEILPRYVAFAMIGVIAFKNRARLHGKPAAILGSSLAASLFFYLFTNTTSWIGDPGYAKNFAGWAQSVTIGLPGYLPTWVFLRNSVISDLLFTALFLVSIVAGKKIQSPSLTPNPVTQASIQPH